MFITLRSVHTCPLTVHGTFKGIILTEYSCTKVDSCVNAYWRMRGAISLQSTESLYRGQLLIRDSLQLYYTMVETRETGQLNSIQYAYIYARPASKLMNMRSMQRCPVNILLRTST